jgi:hypothetical protein
MIKKRYVFLLIGMLVLLLIGCFFLTRFSVNSIVSPQVATADATLLPVEKNTPANTGDEPKILPALAEPPSSTVQSAYTLWTQAELSDKTDAHRFHKVDVGGRVLSDTASAWQCVYDNLTGLLWEVKRADGGWQDYEHTYSWYQPSVDDLDGLSQVAGSDVTELPYVKERGKADVGTCYDVYCDTYHYTQTFNEVKICGSSDWRLPYAHELGYLDHDTHYYPDIETHYFPNTAIAHYWSRTETPKVSSLAWSVDFKDGFPYISEKRIPYRVSLVVDALDLSDQISP